MSRSVHVVLGSAIALWFSPGLAKERPLQLLPELTPAPAAGIDPDYARAIDEAERLLDAGKSNEATARLVTLLSGTDSFLLAQREEVGKRAVPLLRRASEAEAQQGNLEAAAFARDAAWIASGHVADPVHAQLLLSLAERARGERPQEALWLARRAARANPLDGRAAALDAQWSSNPLRYAGWGMMAGGGASLIASAVLAGMASETGNTLTTSIHPRAEVDSLLATQRTLGLATVGAIVAGVGLFYGGVGVVMLGNPEGKPVSPALLPALKETP